MREREIKLLLHKSLRCVPNELVLNELPICGHSVRVDLAVVNGTLSGFEIKGSADNLNRLTNQISHYDQVFEFSSVVADKKHFPQIRKLLPAHWGIIQVTCAQQLDYIRQPKKNRHTSCDAVARLLWTIELVDILNDLGWKKLVQIPSRRILRAILISKLNSSELIPIVAMKIKTRQHLRLGGKRA